MPKSGNLVTRQPKAKPKGKVLTQLDAAKKRTELVRIIEWTTEQQDLAIKAIVKGHAYKEIWSDISHEEAEVIADVLLRKARQSAEVAGLIDQIFDRYDQARVGAIVAPRAIETIHHLMMNGISLW